MSAKGQWEKFNCSGISGHTHRVGSYKRTTGRGTDTWIEQGCLCELKPGYIIGPPDWQQGFAFGIAVDGHVYLQEVAMENHSYFYDGKLYGVNFKSQDLQEYTPHLPQNRQAEYQPEQKGSHPRW